MGFQMIITFVMALTTSLVSGSAALGQEDRDDHCDYSHDGLNVTNVSADAVSNLKTLVDGLPVSQKIVSSNAYRSISEEIAVCNPITFNPLQKGFFPNSNIPKQIPEFQEMMTYLTVLTRHERRLKTLLTLSTSNEDPEKIPLEILATRTLIVKLVKHTCSLVSVQ